MDILGPVTVNTLEVVKFVTAAAIGLTGIWCLFMGIDMMSDGELLSGIDREPIDGLLPGLSFLSSLGIWHVADKAQAKIEVSSTKSAQEKELQRFEKLQNSQLSRA